MITVFNKFKYFKYILDIYNQKYDFNYNYYYL